MRNYKLRTAREHVSPEERKTYIEKGTLPSSILTYTYNASGLVTQVKKNNVPLVKFFYNDRNHRVKKETYGGTNGDKILSTHYVRDVGGQVMAIYNEPQNGTPKVAEYPVYGSGRIGIYKPGSTPKTLYGLTDHLGNLRTVFSVTDTNSGLTNEGYSDYFPFGMPMPGRNIVGDYRYAFQGQEKDSETGKEAFELRLWDSRIGRWLTTDPAGQYSSPYLGIGNDPINGIDPDGGYRTWFGAFLAWAGGGFKGRIQSNNSSKLKGNKSFGLLTFEGTTGAINYGKNSPSIWNHRATRLYTGDGISIGGSYSANAIVGVDLGGEFTWIFRGPDASFVPNFEFGPAVSISDGGQLTANAWISKKWHAGKISEIKATDLGGYSAFADVGFTAGIGGSIGGDVAGNFNNGQFQPTWISATLTGSIGAQASPLTAVQVEAGVRHNSILIHNDGKDVTIFHPNNKDSYNFSIDK